MRSTHSIAVRSFGIALAAAFASAPALGASVDYFLKIEGVAGESAHKDHKGEIEILSYSWGVSQASAGHTGGGMGAGKVQVVAGDVNGDGRADTPVAAGADSAGKFGAVGGMHRADSLIPSQTVKSPRDPASGLATGKRTHDPVRFIKPLEKGSISLKMKLAGCAVGTHFPSAELSTPEGRYALQDVVVAGCGEQVTLNYAKVRVRGWNPEKKE